MPLLRRADLGAAMLDLLHRAVELEGVMQRSAAVLAPVCP